MPLRVIPALMTWIMRQTSSIDINMDQSNRHLELSYALINTIMFLPVILIPMLTVGFHTTGLLCIALFLMVAVTMDTILYKISNFKQAVDAVLWVILTALIIISTFASQDAAYPVAILFMIHSSRSGYHLFVSHKNHNHWWLWPAWIRDISASLTIFIISFKSM